VRTRRQKATLGDGVTRAPTQLTARLMHAAVQLLRAADDPPDATDGDWQSLLYGGLSDESSDADTATGTDGAGLETLVRRRTHADSRHNACTACICARVQGRAVDVDPAAVLALADVGADDEAGEQWRQDPLRGADLRDAAVRTLMALMHVDCPFFDAALVELNKDEAEYLRGAFDALRAAEAAAKAEM
jgi:hypothetical protein